MQPHFLYGMVDLNIKDVSNIPKLLPRKSHLTFAFAHARQSASSLVVLSRRE